MCFGGKTPPPVPPPAAPPAVNPVQTESGDAAEKGAVADRASGTSQLRVDLDPTVSNMGKNTGLQITK